MANGTRGVRWTGHSRSAGKMTVMNRPLYFDPLVNLGVMLFALVRRGLVSAREGVGLVGILTNGQFSAMRWKMKDFAAMETNLAPNDPSPNASPKPSFRAGSCWRGFLRCPM